MLTKFTEAPARSWPEAPHKVGSELMLAHSGVEALHRKCMLQIMAKAEQGQWHFMRGIIKKMRFIDHCPTLTTHNNPFDRWRVWEC